MPTQPIVRLYLENWQKRMLKDFSDLKKIDQMKTVWFKPKGGCLASYKVPPGGMRPGDWLIYLTDSQMQQVRENLNLRTPIATVNVTMDGIRKGLIGFE